MAGLVGGGLAVAAWYVLERRTAAVSPPPQKAETAVAVARPTNAADAAAEAPSPAVAPVQDNATATFARQQQELRRQVDAALMASDFEAADRHVDECLAQGTFTPQETQRLMAMKMSSRGMRGDHAAMLQLMDEIIAVAPSSELAAKMKQQRPQIETLQRQGGDHNAACDTCGSLHEDGKHPGALPVPPSQP